MKNKKEKLYYFDLFRLNGEDNTCYPIGTHYMKCDHVPSNSEICGHLVSNKNTYFNTSNTPILAVFKYFGEMFECVKLTENVYVTFNNIRTIE